MSGRQVLLVFLAVGAISQPQSAEASTKKGLCIGPGNFLCDDFKALTNFNWWYDWGKNVGWIRSNSNCSLDSFAPNFIPMIWGWRPHHDYPVVIPQGTPYLLVFNEPNVHSQGNISAGAAANHWKVVQSHAHGTPLVGPATAICNNPHNCHGNSTQWLDQFFQHCNGSCHMDYLGAHVYNCDADQSMDYLNMLYTRYGKKIWLTEFACPHTHSVNVQLHYMHQMLPRLEAADYIVKYSWFNSRVPGDGFVTSSASLLELNESKLTPLGRYYIHFRGSSGPAIVG